MINFIVKLISATITGVLMMSCSLKADLGNSIAGSGNVTTEKRMVDSFEKIKVSNGLECIIQQSDKTEVTVEADDNLQKGIKTTVENGVLVISSEYNNYKNVKSKKIIVLVPKITDLESNSGSLIKSVNVLTGDKLQIKSSSGSVINIEAEVDNITLESSSGSEQKVRGKALFLYTDSSSGSSIDAKRLLVNEVSSKSSSGSTTTVNAIVSLQANASSGSSVNYFGSPKNISAKENSGGSIRMK